MPDGSGALIRFSDSGRGASPYNQPVYGSDPSVNLLLKSVDNTQSVRLPVFGMQKAGHAFLAVIHAGAAARFHPGRVRRRPVSLYGGEQRLYLSSAGLDRHPG